MDKRDLSSGKCTTSHTLILVIFEPKLISSLINLSLIFSIDRLVVWSTQNCTNCQSLFPKAQDYFLNFLVLSTTQRYVVYCHIRAIKPEKQHIWEAKIREFFVLKMTQNNELTNRIVSN